MSLCVSFSSPLAAYKKSETLSDRAGSVEVMNPRAAFKYQLDFLSSFPTKLKWDRRQKTFPVKARTVIFIGIDVKDFYTT